MPNQEADVWVYPVYVAATTARTELGWDIRHDFSVLATLITPLPIVGLDASAQAHIEMWVTADGAMHHLRIKQEGKPELKLFNHPFQIVQD